jgi:hypothetical protein
VSGFWSARPRPQAGSSRQATRRQSVWSLARPGGRSRRSADAHARRGPGRASGDCGVGPVDGGLAGPVKRQRSLIGTLGGSVPGRYATHGPRAPVERRGGGGRSACGTPNRVLDGSEPSPGGPRKERRRSPEACRGRSGTAALGSTTRSPPVVHESPCVHRCGTAFPWGWSSVLHGQAPAVQSVERWSSDTAELRRRQVGGGGDSGYTTDAGPHSSACSHQKVQCAGVRGSGK